MIHGRFQPFHNGHLEYLRGAAARSDVVFVGITNPDPARIKEEPSDPLRHLPESNPFSYVERLLMVTEVAQDEGIRGARDPVPRQRAGALAGVRAGGRDAVPPPLLRLGRHEARPPARGGLRGRRARRGRREGNLRAWTCVPRCAAVGDWEALVPPGVARVIRSLERLPV